MSAGFTSIGPPLGERGTIGALMLFENRVAKEFGVVADGRRSPAPSAMCGSAGTPESPIIAEHCGVLATLSMPVHRASLFMLVPRHKQPTGRGHGRADGAVRGVEVAASTSVPQHPGSDTQVETGQCGVGMMNALPDLGPEAG